MSGMFVVGLEEVAPATHPSIDRVRSTMPGCTYDRLDLHQSSIH